MSKFKVVKGGEAVKQAHAGQNMRHASAALGSVQEAMRHERDKMNQAHLRKAFEHLRQVKQPAVDDAKSRALRRV